MRDNPLLRQYAHLADGDRETDEQRAKSIAAEDLRIREMAASKLASVIGKRYGECRLSNFKVENAKQKKVVEALNALDLGASIREGRGFVFYGPVGTGKDHLMAAMLFRAVDLPTTIRDGARCGVSVNWVNGLELLGRFRDGISRDASEAVQLAGLLAPDVLAISDPCPPMAMRDESWRIEILYRVLDARYRACKSTWLTINANSIDEIDGKLTAPVFDRLQHGAEVFACCWPSWRMAKRS